MRRYIVDRATLEIDITVGCRLKPRQHHERRGFAGARWAKHGEKLTLRNIQVEIFNDEGFAIIRFLDIHKTHNSVLFGF